MNPPEDDAAAAGGAPEQKYTVRTDPEKLRRVVAELPDAQRPAAWEHLLFGSVLRTGKDRLEPSWRDHQLRLPTSTYRRLEEDEVADFVAEAYARLRWIVRPLERVFDAHEDAFGRPGEPGDAALIQHFAEWIASVYKQLLDWSGEVRSADPPEALRRTLELLAHSADAPIEQIRGFIDHVGDELDRIPEHLSQSEADRSENPLRLELVLELFVDEFLLEEVLAELETGLA